MLLRHFITSFLVFIVLNFLFPQYFLPNDSLVSLLSWDYSETEMIDITDQYIGNGGDINSRGNFLSYLDDLELHVNFTALHISVLKNYVAFAHFLIEKGADINAIDEEGNSPLHLAASRQSLEFMEIFITSRKGDLKLKNNSGKSVISAINKNFNLGGKIKLEELFKANGLNSQLIRNGVPPLPKSDEVKVRKTNPKRVIPNTGVMDIEVTPVNPSGPAIPTTEKLLCRALPHHTTAPHVEGMKKWQLCSTNPIPGTGHYRWEKNNNSVPK